jgi:hypothetical protein
MLVAAESSATENHFIQIPGIKGLPGQKRTAGLERQIGGGEWARCCRFEERSATAVNDKNRSAVMHVVSGD